MKSTKVLVPSGVLGLGFDLKALNSGIKKKPDIIAIDGGSTDSGPYSLGSGSSKYSRAAVKAEWKTLMEAREKANIPLIIGSSGTCGTDGMVDWMEEITIEVAKELDQNLKIAKLYCEQQKDYIKINYKNNKISPLKPAPYLDINLIDNMTHIVALAGAEQIQKCLKTGADIILAGRTTDTAIISALPLMQGEDPGASWHGAKIAECGALCSSNPTSGVVLVEFDKIGFTVEAMSENAFCTPETVAAHMLYENADPFILLLFCIVVVRNSRVDLYCSTCSIRNIISNVINITNGSTNKLVLSYWLKLFVELCKLDKEIIIWSTILTSRVKVIKY